MGELDNDLDLRQYIKSLLRHWRLILLLTLVGGLAAAIVSLIQPNIYEAIALVSVSAPRSTLRLQDVNQDQTVPVRAYPELALSGDVVAPIFEKVKSLLPPKVNTLDKFKDQLS